MKVCGAQDGNLLRLSVYRKISTRLWDDLRLLCVGQQFIIGYLASLMPAINRRLLDNRYYRGHLLSRTFAIFELMNVRVVVASRRVTLNWPRAISHFPPAASLSADVNAIYIHDYVDAINAYFRNEYDDCVRRVITATENFIQAKNWKAKPNNYCKVANIFSRLLPQRFGQDGFRRSLSHNLNLSRISGEVINENLQFVYSIRNRIVHSGYRISLKGNIFCDKAICSLYYLIYGHSGDLKISQYAYILHMQFTMLKNLLGELYNLGEIERMKSRNNLLENVVDTAEEFENYMFTALRFTKDDKRTI